MAIVRGAFIALLAPGLARTLSGVDGTTEVEAAEKMAILHPDTSAVPIWRQRPKRMEHPITAWRCWGLRKDDNDKWALSSVAADCIWEGPVIRAHKRPVDPKYWDGLDRKSNEYHTELNDTFAIAGIHALKTEGDARLAARDYHVSCYGEVALWGRIAQFTLGYRAEVCMVKRLFLSRSMYTMLRLKPEAVSAWVYENGSDTVFNDSEIASRIAAVIHDLSTRYECEVIRL